MAGQQFPQADKNASENTKLQIQGEPWDASKPAKRPGGIFRIHKGEAWFSIYANNPSEDDKAKRINIKFGIQDAYSILAAIRRCIADPGAERITFEAWNYTFMNRQRSDKPSEQGKITIGRNGEGCVMLVAQFPQRPACQFIFGGTYWTRILNSAGAPLDKKTASEVVAQGWSDALSHILAIVGVDTFVDYAAEKRKKEASQGGGQSNNGGGNYGGNSNTDSGTTTNADALFG